MNYLLWKLGICSVVWTVDHDGERRCRIVRVDRRGKQFVYGISRRYVGYLEKDGTVSGGGYMKRWLPYEQKPPQKPSGHVWFSWFRAGSPIEPKKKKVEKQAYEPYEDYKPYGWSE